MSNYRLTVKIKDHAISGHLCKKISEENCKDINKAIKKDPMVKAPLRHLYEEDNLWESVAAVKLLLSGNC